ncbi:MAG: superoxide dismutase, partial [Candidatus Neptunochlamydia sp.]|nr:superoxide dismutase [Candidatus Neptunochlamydia sp.]
VLPDKITYGILKRRFGWEYDGMVFYELYFENLGKKHPLLSKSLLYQKITYDFSSFENWRKDFPAIGTI